MKKERIIYTGQNQPNTTTEVDEDIAKRLVDSGQYVYADKNVYTGDRTKPSNKLSKKQVKPKPSESE